MREFLDTLPMEEKDAVAIAMTETARHGLHFARHLRGNIYEVRATTSMKAFRILFALEGRYNQILLSLEGFQKQTQRTPPARIDLAERRLADWRSRGAKRARTRKD